MKTPLVLSQCTLRPWRVEDAESLARHANNREVSINLRDRFPFPYTIDDANAFLARVVAEKPLTKFCIEIDGAAAGGIGLEMQDDVHRFTAEFGYWLGQEFWGRGIMTEAVRAYGDWAFANLALRRLCAQCYSSNPASTRVLEKAGFVFEGRLKNHVFKAGRLLDSLVYARTT